MKRLILTCALVFGSQGFSYKCSLTELSTSDKPGGGFYKEFLLDSKNSSQRITIMGNFQLHCDLEKDRVACAFVTEGEPAPTSHVLLEGLPREFGLFGSRDSDLKEERTFLVGCG